MKRYGRLKEEIKKQFGNQKAFADCLGINVSTLNQKLNGKVDWSISDVQEVCEVLHIPMSDVQDYFFYQ